MAEAEFVMRSFSDLWLVGVVIGVVTFVLTAPSLCDWFNERYHFVNWYPDWQGAGFARLNPRITDLAFIYEWLCAFGFWELRKLVSSARRNQMVAEDKDT